MLKVGLTGGIGSGKTTVAHLFELLAIPVYYADDRAKHLMQHESDVREALRTIFGMEVYDKDGALNRSYLADQVFDDKEKLEKLNSIVHPAVGADFEDWCAEQSDAPYALKEAALIFETSGHKALDYTMLVWAPEAMRIERVITRDNTDAASVRARMKNQMTDREKVPFADFVIVNDGAHSLVRQVTEVHHLLLSKAAREKDAQTA